MKDLKNKNIIYLKGFLFLFVGIIASLVILIEHPTIKTAILLIIAIWAFARAYYFAFYVIEHYVDESFKYSGLISFIRYICSKDNKADKFKS